MPESADGKNFSGSKVFCFTNVEGVRNFVRVFSRNSARVQNYSNCLLVLRKKNLKCFPSSRFEPRSFAECLQNLLIEKKNQWKDFGDFSKKWT